MRIRNRRSFIKYAAALFCLIFLSGSLNPMLAAEPAPAAAEPGPAATALAPAAADSSQANPEPARYNALIQDLTRQLIFSFADEKSGETSALLRELRNVSPETSKAWEQILPYWEQVNQENFVNVAAEADLKKEAASKPSENADPTRTSENAPASNAPENEPSSDNPENAFSAICSDAPLPADLPDDDSLCIVILGYALNENGTMRDELIARLRLGLACANQYPNAYVLVTGGATAAKAPKATEADCMAQWLTENGNASQTGNAPVSSRIIIENRSRTSSENAIFSYEILKKEYPQVNNIVIVTSDYHVPAGCLLFQSSFLLEECLSDSADADPVEGERIRVIANAGVDVHTSAAYPISTQASRLFDLAQIVLFR